MLSSLDRNCDAVSCLLAVNHACPPAQQVKRYGNRGIKSSASADEGSASDTRACRRGMMSRGMTDMPGFDDEEDDFDEADAAWAEMHGGGGAMYMGSMAAALPASPTNRPTTRLSPELTHFLSGLARPLAQAQPALEQCGIVTVPF